MRAKVVVFLRFGGMIPLFFDDFNKKASKSFGGLQKSSTFAPQFRTSTFGLQTLGYGVMVTLQILVLPFLVRVRVPQQINPLSH